MRHPERALTPDGMGVRSECRIEQGVCQGVIPPQGRKEFPDGPSEGFRPEGGTYYKEMMSAGGGYLINITSNITIKY